MPDFVYIIAEFDPPHRGHAYLVSEARRAFPGAAVVAVMSGHFTERGEPAFADKFARARAALAIGCDLVLSLPFPFSSSSAENFARGGVGVAAAFAKAFPASRHVLVFGSESGDTEAVATAARRTSAEEYRSRLYAAANGGHNARDMRAVYASLWGEDAARILDGANDALGIEYIRAVALSGADIEPFAVRRVGAGHGGDPVGGIASSSYIRRAVAANDASAWEYVPEAVRDILSSCPRGLPDGGRIRAAIHVALRLADVESVDSCAECGGGVGRRIVRAAAGSGTYDGMIALAATKQYTNARLRRAALMAAVGVPRVEGFPAYTQLLAANGVGVSVLHGYRGALPVLTKPADADKLPADARAAAALEARADAIFTLGFAPPLPAAAFVRVSPYITGAPRAGEAL